MPDMFADTFAEPPAFAAWMENCPKKCQARGACHDGFPSFSRRHRSRPVAGPRGRLCRPIGPIARLGWRRFRPRFAIRRLMGLDGRRIAYVKKSGGRELLVVDGEEQPAFDRVASPTFSPDSKWFAYAAAVGDTWRDRRSAASGSPYPRVGPPVFGPDSRRLAIADG